MLPPEGASLPYKTFLPVLSGESERTTKSLSAPIAGTGELKDHRTRGPCSASLVLIRVRVWEIRSLEQKC